MNADPTSTTLDEAWGHGTPAPAGRVPLSTVPLVVLVGVTGVGKSTTIAALTDLVPAVRVLPDRRELTDTLIISHLQQRDGAPIAPVTDRAERFAYTRRYRTLYPGGMAHALSQLWLSPHLAAQPLLFDGLRGEDEVTAAVTLLPHATFAVLDAPDAVRIRRLLGRQDAFDQISGMAHAADDSFDALGVPEAAPLLAPAERDALVALVTSGAVPAAALAAKLKIVAEERRNYDPTAAIAALRTLAPARTIVIDTTRSTPADAATVLASHLQMPSPVPTHQSPQRK